MLLHDIEAQLRQDARLARAFATRRAEWLRKPCGQVRNGTESFMKIILPCISPQILRERFSPLTISFMSSWVIPQVNWQASLY